MRILPLLLLTAACQRTPPAVAAEPSAEASPEAEASADAPDIALGWERLRFLTDDIGHRLTGSPGLERAIEWAVSELENDGFDAVRAEPVEARRWVRGHERVTLTESGRASRRADARQ